MTSRALKPWRFTEEETFASFTSSQQHRIYVLNQDATNKPFLLPTSPAYGLVDDVGENGFKKEVKLLHLNTVLGFITQFVPHYLSAEVLTSSNICVWSSSGEVTSCWTRDCSTGHMLPQLTMMLKSQTT